MNKPISKMRLPVELRQIEKTSKEHGITCETMGDDFSQLLAKIPGPKGSPYEGNTFEMSITISAQYPFRPPSFKFVTPVYHPNIDNAGNICLDLLRMPPKGSYNPAITLESILLSIQLLLATPNPDDPLNGEAADLYKSNRKQYLAAVKSHLKEQQHTARVTRSTPRTEVAETAATPGDSKRLKLNDI